MKNTNATVILAPSVYAAMLCVLLRAGKKVQIASNFDLLDKIQIKLLALIMKYHH